MEKYDFIDIQDVSFAGINSPVLIISGEIYQKNFKFELYIDDKSVDFELKKENKKFTIKKELKRSDKNIKLYVVIRTKKYLVVNKDNKVISRISKKISSNFKYLFSRIRILNKIGQFFGVLYRGIRFFWREYHFLVPPKLWGKYFKDFIRRVKEIGHYPFYDPFNSKDYKKWLKENEEYIEVKKFKYNPLISIVIPVYNIEPNLLSECLDSILKQTYTNFEVCLADDNSTNKDTIETLKQYEKKDKRIKVVYRKENGHISKATNSAIEIAKGEFIALMDDDDVIIENALYEVVKVLNENPKLDLIYSDEDKMEMNGELCDPHFKPDYSPDTLFGGNYICHFSFYRKKIIDKIGGFRSEYVGAQDFDLVLRFVEQTDKIYHLPKVLYHWRKVPGSTAVTIDSKSYAIENGKKAIEDALKRRGLKGKVNVPINAAHYIVEYDTPNNPKISIIIPTKDNHEILENCLDSIYKKTTYKNYEVIIVNNQSTKKAAYNLFDKYKKKYKNFKVIDADYEFNYSKINNDAVDKATGDYILLLNNDTEVITERWLEVMLGYAMQDHIGAVGAKLFYPDGTIQHGGIILGIGGIAAHAYPEVDGDSYGTFGRLLIPYNYSGVTAACLMIKKSKYKEVKGLDEGLRVAYNDVDFNMKLLEKGYYNVFLPQVHLIHYESKTRGLDTSTKKYNRLQQETKYMKDKWGNKLTHDRFYNPNYSLKRDFRLDKK